MTFAKIYFISIVVSLVLTGIRRKDFLEHFGIAVILCLIPVINSIWAFAIIVSFFEKTVAENDMYYLMYSGEHNNLFVYNEEQHKSYIIGVSKTSDENYECIEISKSSQDIIEIGIKESIKRNCHFNSKFKLN